MGKLLSAETQEVWETAAAQQKWGYGMAAEQTSCAGQGPGWEGTRWVRGWAIEIAGNRAAELGGGAVKLGDGVAELGDGAAELGDGAAELGDGVAELGDGVFLLVSSGIHQSQRGKLRESSHHSRLLGKGDSKQKVVVQHLVCHCCWKQREQVHCQ